MIHHTPLITTIVVGLVLAAILGTIASRLRVSPLVGYLMAGVLVGPFTPGLTVDQGLAAELAEIGVILLMFGVGLHFSLNDLLSSRAIALPGALAQIMISTLLGMGLAWMLDWPFSAGIVFGLALSVASTVVLLRAMQDRQMIESEQGRIAVSWLIVEDIFVVLALVLLPALADFVKDDPQTHNGYEVIFILTMTISKIIGFLVATLVVGRRVIPWMLRYAAHSGSKELFRLTVLAIALGVAYGASELFGVSFALGAFFAGMILAESELSQQAARESLPLRDAFAVLFFVSVGMLFNPMIVVEDFWPLVATVLIIIFGKSIAAFLIVLAFRHPLETAVTISVSLAQIGEFSFILAGLGVTLGLLPEQGRDLILAGAILSIFFNPLLFTASDKLLPWLEKNWNFSLQGKGEHKTDAPAILSPKTGHAVIVGYGRVGRLLVDFMSLMNQPIVVLEERPEIVDELRKKDIESYYGNASTPEILNMANIPQAKWLFLAMPNIFESGRIIQQAQKLNPGIEIVARAHSDAEVEHLRKHGAKRIIMGEQEIARAMFENIFGITN